MQSNKTVLITGASRGIGRETARLFASKHYNLVLVCKVNIGPLEELAKELTATYSVTVTTFYGDISDFSFIQSMFESIREVDLLINNAAIAHFGLLQDMSVCQWKEVMETNVNSCFYTSKLAIPMMLQKGAGKMINISSIWGTCGASMEVAYSTSKGAMNAFTKALAKELAPSNIQVNAVSFGMIATDMNQQHLSEDEIAAFISEIPTGRSGTAIEAAQMIYQIATSPDYLTGQIITMDGGLS